MSSSVPIFRLFHIILITSALLTTGRETATATATRLPHAKKVCTRKICREVTTMPHTPTTVFLNAPPVKVPIYVWYNRQRIRQPRRLAIIMPAALVRGSDYSKLAAHLSRRGITTAIPMYASRNRSDPIVDETIRKSHMAGYKCPRFGVFATARLINSVTDFLAVHMRDVSLHRMLVIGHSFGGAVSAFALMGTCATPPASLSEQITNDAFCEGYLQTSLFSVSVLVTFEASFPKSGHVPDHLLVVQITSSLSDLIKSVVPVQLNESIAEVSLVTQNFSEIASGSNRVLEVRMKNGTNHLGPVNYVPETRHSRALCGLERPPPENRFVSTRKTQMAVVASIADVITTAQKSFAGGLGAVRRARAQFEDIDFVHSATFAA